MEIFQFNYVTETTTLMIFKTNFLKFIIFHFILLGH